METKYTSLVYAVDYRRNDGAMPLFGWNTKQRTEVHPELRRGILGLDRAIEKQNAGIHEDALFVGRTMLM